MRLLALAALAALAGCSDFPRDPQHTLDHVRHGSLRVGVSHDPPFVILREDGAPEGREIAMLEDFARTLDSRIVWIKAGHSDLMLQLETFQLDAVVGGNAHDSPWEEHVALSRPYLVTGPSVVPESRRLALPPGENAWLMAVDRFTSGRTPDSVSRDATVAAP